MKNKIGLIILLITFLVGCSNKAMEIQQPIEKLENNEQIEVTVDDGHINEFYNLLKTETNLDKIYDYFDTNADKVSSEIADTFVNGIVSFDGNIKNVDYTRLSKNKEYMSEEMASFVTFMEAEQEKPSITDKGIQVTLGDLLEKVSLLENSLIQYPNSLTYKYNYDLFFEYLSMVITGGYSEVNNMKNIYLNADGIHLDEYALDEYYLYIEEYPNTVSANVIAKYIQVMKNSENVIDENVKIFYTRIVDIIRDVYNLGE